MNLAKTSWLVAASVLVAGSAACLAPATEQDLEGLGEDQESGDIGAHEEDLLSRQSTNGYHCSPTSCRCIPDAPLPEDTCMNMTQGCGGNPILCCKKLSFGTVCEERMNAFADYCFCNL